MRHYVFLVCCLIYPPFGVNAQHKTNAYEYPQELSFCQPKQYEASTEKIKVEYQLIIDSHSIQNGLPITKCIEGQQSKQWPIMYIDEKLDELLIYDTFWVKNPCDDTLYFKAGSSSKGTFSHPSFLPPRQEMPIAFSGKVLQPQVYFDIFRFHYLLSTTDGSFSIFNIEVPTVGKQAKVFYRDNGQIAYAIEQKKGARFSKILFIDKEGSLDAIGTIQDQDTNLKVGTWFYFNKGLSSNESRTYSKVFKLSALDEHDRLHGNFKLKVLENGKWIVPNYESNDNESWLYVNPAAKSILAYNDSASFQFSFNYKKIKATTEKEFYLLRPNDATLKIGNKETPFKLYKHQYALILNPNQFAFRSKHAYQAIDSIIAELTNEYPQLLKFEINGQAPGIDIGQLKDQERSKLFKQLSRDTNIAFVSQLYSVKNNSKLLYGDNRVYAVLNIEWPLQFIIQAKIMGFKSVDYDVSNLGYWLTVDSKIIDEKFFKAYNRLSRHRMVNAAYLFEPYKIK